MFIGYPEGGKSWRLWCEDGKTSKCFISQNIVFKETEYYMETVDHLARKASMEVQGKGLKLRWIQFQFVWKG